jgi:hypothetical protein
MPPRINDDRIARLRRVFIETGSVALAARAAGMDRRAAYQRLGVQGPRREFTTGTRRVALELYGSGMSAASVEEELRRRGYKHVPSREAIGKWAHAAGVARSRSRSDELGQAVRRGRDYDELRRQVRYLATERLLSITRIAKELGVSRNFVRRAMPTVARLNSRSAVERRIWQAYLPDVERRRAAVAEVARRRAAGESIPAIAAAVGISPMTVWRYCRRSGLTHPRKRAAVAA